MPRVMPWRWYIARYADVGRVPGKVRVPRERALWQASACTFCARGRTESRIPAKGIGPRISRLAGAGDHLRYATNCKARGAVDESRD